MTAGKDTEYLHREQDFIEDLTADLDEMVKQDPLRLYAYITQQITGVLVSPEWNIYQASAILPDDMNKSQAMHIWRTIMERVAGFCADTEGDRTGRDQADWILLRIYNELFKTISGRVLAARMRAAPKRI